MLLIVAGLGVVGKTAATDICTLTSPKLVGDVSDRPPGKPACVPVADALLSSGSIRTAVRYTGVLAVVACFCAEESSSDSVRFAAGVDCVPVAVELWFGKLIGEVRQLASSSKEVATRRLSKLLNQILTR